MKSSLVATSRDIPDSVAGSNPASHTPVPAVPGNINNDTLMDKLHWMDCVEIGAHVLGKQEEYENDELSYQEVYDLLYEKFEVTSDAWDKIINALIFFIPAVPTEISGVLARGFVDKTGKSFIAKLEAESIK